MTSYENNRYYRNAHHESQMTYSPTLLPIPKQHTIIQHRATAEELLSNLKGLYSPRNSHRVIVTTL